MAQKKRRPYDLDPDLVNPKLDPASEGSEFNQQIKADREKATVFWTSKAEHEAQVKEKEEALRVKFAEPLQAVLRGPGITDPATFEKIRGLIREVDGFQKTDPGAYAYIARSLSWFGNVDGVKARLAEYLAVYG